MKYRIIRRIFLMIVFLGNIFFLHAQELENIILVGDNGITEDIKEAKNFVVIKKYPNATYERLDYMLYGPLKKLRTYSDSTLTVLSGRSYEYDNTGQLTYYGYYSNNKKDGEWSYMNDTGKVVKKERYENGVLVDPDVKDTIKKKDTLSYPDEREATFKKSPKDFKTYVERNIDQEAGDKSVKGGRVIVRFVVNTKGATDNIYLEKSVEYVLDEALIKVIRNSPLWTPAFQNGKQLNAYRRQWVEFKKE